MEPLNSIDKLSLLEKKIISLVEIIKDLKAENIKLAEDKTTLLARIEEEKNQLIVRLEEERNQLALRLEMVENSLLKGAQNIEELNQERVLTKMVVDELINSIDRLVEHEQQ